MITKKSIVATLLSQPFSRVRGVLAIGSVSCVICYVNYLHGPLLYYLPLHNDKVCLFLFQ